MSLDQGYGVVIGTRDSYYRDPVNDYGQYYHGNLKVRTPAGVYHCAIDVDSHSLPNGVLWRVVEVRPSMLKGVNGLAAGWHPLTANQVSGALDYIRNPDLKKRRLGCLDLPLSSFLRRVALTSEQPWRSGVSTDALNDLEPLIAHAARVFVYGEPFDNGGLGVHNVHQNQGDPIGSQWSRSNGIWQDGATIIQRMDGTFAAFCNKFKTQSDRTDDNGRPLP